MSKTPQARFRYIPQEGGSGFLVMHCGDRIGIVLEAAPKSWAMWDTYFVPIRGRKTTRHLAAQRILDRYINLYLHQEPEPVQPSAFFLRWLSR